MNQDNKLLLKLKINLKNTYEIKAKDKTIVQILFDGMLVVTILRVLYCQELWIHRPYIQMEWEACLPSIP